MAAKKAGTETCLFYLKIKYLNLFLLDMQSRTAVPTGYKALI